MKERRGKVAGITGAGSGIGRALAGAIRRLFNDAGVTPKKSLQASPLEEIDFGMGVNLWGVIHGCHGCLPLPKKQGEAHIVNPSSLAGVRGFYRGAAPGDITVITPPCAQRSLLSRVRAGRFPTSTAESPGHQPPVHAGTQGIGVSAPCDADVADATAGLLMLMQTPKGMTFAIGVVSPMFAANVSPGERLTGTTFSWLGVVPKLHCSIAPR